MPEVLAQWTARLTLDETGSISPNDLGIEPPTSLHRALLRRVVHVHETESLGEPVGPLEVVEQGPGEVPAEVYTLPQRRVHGAQVVSQVPGAEWIVDQIFTRRRIVEGRSVLRDVEGNRPVALRHPE